MNQGLLILGVTGSIAAYKAVNLARCWIQSGHSVQVLATSSALEFVGAATWLGITNRPVLCRTFDGDPGERHVALWQEARAMVVAPATADVLARLAQGHASDLVTATALCRRGPLYVAPAMHPSMWTNPAVARNVARLRADGVEILGPATGQVASGDVGPGRMLEPEAIAAHVLDSLARKGDLRGRKVIVTAGPTYEDIDPARFVGNRSSGKMGFALARAALERGANVQLVTGPVALEPPAGAETRRVRSALDLEAALVGAEATADVVLMAAAVADFRPKARTAHKRPKTELASALELVPNPDVIAGLARRRAGPRPVLVAFSLGTGDDAQIVALGRRKLADKGVDLIVANAAEDAFEADTNRVHLVTSEGVSSLPSASKAELAHAILDRVVQILERQSEAEAR
jgi:phosphopantothenoylcysteine decarboxylase/phosphopantothenate--cysteine ligase